MLPKLVVSHSPVLPGIDSNAIVLALHQLLFEEDQDAAHMGVHSATKKLRLQAGSLQQRWIAFFVGMVLLLALIVWLRLSARSRILAGLQSLPEVLVVVVILVVLALGLLPKWQAARSWGLTDQNRFDRENEARKT